jgi:hypothetical protein
MRMPNKQPSTASRQPEAKENLDVSYDSSSTKQSLSVVVARAVRVFNFQKESLQHPVLWILFVVLSLFAILAVDIQI